MSQKWRKLGRIFCPQPNAGWMASHASVPIAHNIYGDIFRIYFSARDTEQKSHTGYIVVDINRPDKVLEISPRPIIAPGELGTFDDSGAMATWLTKVGPKWHMYYIGWNLGVTVPFRNSIGVATSDDGVRFSKPFFGPVVDRNLHEPHFAASCCVLFDGDIYRMWYLSCTGWELVNGSPRHRYHIKYAESSDAIHWIRCGKVAIDFKDIGEYAISRPSVIQDGDIWRMWYSYRGEYYRIGYAESQDGVNWRRDDSVCGIDVSEDGWDSESIEYPFVFDHRGTRFMLYNGNSYGKTGIGLAILE